MSPSTFVCSVLRKWVGSFAESQNFLSYGLFHGMVCCEQSPPILKSELAKKDLHHFLEEMQVTANHEFIEEDIGRNRRE